jgi:hypothetical protein
MEVRMKKFCLSVLQSLMMLAFSVFLAFMVTEWMAGCGEYYYDAKGRLVLNECVFIDFPKGE